jgi:hypothetical protein
VDHVAAVGVAECPRVYITAFGCPGTISVLNTISAWEGRHANRKTHEGRARDADAKAGQYPYPEARRNTNSDGDAGPNRVTVAHTPAASNTSANANPNGNAGTNPDPRTNPDSDADTNPNADSNPDTDADPDANADTHPGPDTNTGSRDASLQPCLYDRDGKRGVEQPNR